MPITFGEAKELLAEFAGIGGKCPSAEGVDLFVRKVLDYMLQQGSYGNERAFCFCAERGCVTLPYELEVPLKIRIDNQVSTVWDRWFDYHPVKEWGECSEAQNALTEEPNLSPIAYGLDGPSHIGVLGMDYEDEDAHVIVQGTDTLGNQIYTFHNGEKIAGERIDIKRGLIKYTRVRFANIQAVNKSTTKGYVVLYQYEPNTCFKKFLANYSPVETAPAYRRFKLSLACPQYARVLILGRIRLKPHYLKNDLIPFESIYQLEIAAQQINAMRNDNLQSGAAKDNFLQTLITRENSYKKINNGQPIEVAIPMSGGSVRNIVSGGLGNRFFGRLRGG